MGFQELGKCLLHQPAHRKSTKVTGMAGGGGWRTNPIYLRMSQPRPQEWRSLPKAPCSLLVWSLRYRLKGWEAPNPVGDSWCPDAVISQASLSHLLTNNSNPYGTVLCPSSTDSVCTSACPLRGAGTHGCPVPWKFISEDWKRKINESIKE